MITLTRLSNSPNRLFQVVLIAFVMSICGSVSAAIETSTPTHNSIQRSGFLIAKRQAAANSGEAAKIAQAKHGGKVVKVSAIKSDDGTIYKVKLLLKDGRVKTVTVKGQ